MPTNRRKVTSADLEKEVLDKIKLYQSKGFAEAGRIHELVMQTDPTLHPRLWYGMPGYAKTKDSAVLFFFRKHTYITFGVTDSIKITGEPSFIPTAWYVMKYDESVEEKIIDTVKRATK